MDAITAQEREFLDLISKATPEIVDLTIKYMTLTILDNGFDEAVTEATPPGEKTPPLDVLRKLVDEWAEKEGL